jgi:hypothetical protein
VRRARGLIAAALALVAFALSLPACGGGDDAKTTTSPAPSKAPNGQSVPPSLSSFPPGFVKCLADQGIDVDAVTDVSAVIHSPEGSRCFDQLHGG